MAGISQIAYQWGFKNSTHFGRLFKQHFGFTPSEYRHGFAGHVSPDRTKCSTNPTRRAGALVV
jgi:AraC-like DNA-binding protein